MEVFIYLECKPAHYYKGLEAPELQFVPVSTPALRD